MRTGVRAMTRRLRYPGVCCLFLLAACSRSIPDSGPDAAVTEEEGGLFAQAAIPADSAIAIANARVPGRIAKAELEKEDGALIYSFDIKVVGKAGVTEVHVDAKTGAVLKVEGES